MLTKCDVFARIDPVEIVRSGQYAATFFAGDAELFPQLSANRDEDDIVFLSERIQCRFLTDVDPQFDEDAQIDDTLDLGVEDMWWQAITASVAAACRPPFHDGHRRLRGTLGGPSGRRTKVRPVLPQ